MGTFASSRVCLRVMGDELLPDNISELLGCEPSFAQYKGQLLVGKVSQVIREAKFGIWRLSVSEQVPENLDAQVSEILGKLTPDLSIWTELGHRFEVNLFCGCFMQSGNDGLSMSAESLAALGVRGIELQLDVYDANE